MVRFQLSGKSRLRARTLLFASSLTGFDRLKAGPAEAVIPGRNNSRERRPSSMIQGDRGRRQSKTDPSLELLSKPVASMVPGFVLVPVVTLPSPLGGDGRDPV
jgi:hypothetical protein